LDIYTHSPGRIEKGAAYFQIPDLHNALIQPLPFLGLASQKNFIAVYHMGIYANPDLLNWFKEEYGRITPQDWISTYEQYVKR
jgi:hypothetical protein